MPQLNLSGSYLNYSILFSGINNALPSVDQYFQMFFQALPGYVCLNIMCFKEIACVTLRQCNPERKINLTLAAFALFLEHD